MIPIPDVMKFKLPNPPSWKTLRWINAVTATFCIVLAIIAGPSWLSMVDATLGGFLIGRALWIDGHSKMTELFDEQSALLHVMMELNGPDRKDHAGGGR